MKPISEPRDWPEDFRYPSPSRYFLMRMHDDLVEERDPWFENLHSHSWLSLQELIDHDYDEASIKRLGTDFFEDLAALQNKGVERIVFAFDS